MSLHVQTSVSACGECGREAGLAILCATKTLRVCVIVGDSQVNVFLGLGLPWTIASVYWKFVGATSEWSARCRAQFSESNVAWHSAHLQLWWEAWWTATGTQDIWTTRVQHSNEAQKGMFIITFVLLLVVKSCETVQPFVIRISIHSLSHTESMNKDLLSSHAKRPVR
eukprot:6466951-Amphidinium_carterae.1